MGFSQAVSGLNAAANNLDVIGNNIANSATVGFKTATVSFADMFAGSKVGMGVKVAAVTQDFNDGVTTNTNRGLDVAISGNGFYRLADSGGNIFFSRNGQFKLDENRYITNMQGLNLTGYPAAGVPPVIQAGAQPVPLHIPNDMLTAKATTKGAMVVNLNSNDKVPTNYKLPPGANPAATPPVPGTIGPAATFDPTNPNAYNYTSSITTYDSLGNAHNMNMYFAKSGDNAWDVYSVDGSVPTSGDTATGPQYIGSMAFTTSGALTTSPLVFNVSMPALNGSAPSQSVALDFTGSIQQNVGADGVSTKTQDGYATGQMTGYQINDDGTVVGMYSNEQTQLLGQIVLGAFANPEGLSSQGDNVWSATQASGQVLLGTAGSNGFGQMTSGAVEASNVDLSKELVAMIVAQRNYQSNAQTIKTQDSILNTLVNLR